MGQNVITPTKITAVIPISTALSQAFNLSKYSSGRLIMPAAWTAAGIGFQISDTVGGTYVPFLDAAGDGIEVAAAATVSMSYPIPASIFGSSNVKLWSETADSGVNQAAERSVILLVEE